ncbi:MAG: hypothetical protein ABSG27_16910, partial [Candidatus Acidiferrales bacterium]
MSDSELPHFVHEFPFEPGERRQVEVRDWLLFVGLPDISNNVGSVKSFFKQTSPSTSRSGLVRSVVDFSLDDHGS